MSPPGDRREPPADTGCLPAAQRKQAKRACIFKYSIYYYTEYVVLNTVASLEYEHGYEVTPDKEYTS